MKDLITDEKTRAEDVLLGALGVGDCVKISSLLYYTKRVGARTVVTKYVVFGSYTDSNEAFELQSDFELSDIDLWALDILTESSNFQVKEVKE